MTKSPLVVLAGPSGVGKGTVVAEVRRLFPQVFISVSVTTRSPRPGEVDGVHYHFITDTEFDRLVAGDQLLEWAEVHGLARYGTPAQPIADARRRGEPVLVEIDLAGARQVRQHCPDADLVFLAPPSMEVLVGRLRGRDTESEEEIATRLRTARLEMAAQREFDAVVVNDTVEGSARQVAAHLGLV